jgi:hypothetical protein
MMAAESDDDTADISNALLEAVEDTSDPFTFGDVAAIEGPKRGKKNNQNAAGENLNLFSYEMPMKTKLSGSSFKNMGMVI